MFIDTLSDVKSLIDALVHFACVALAYRYKFDIQNLTKTQTEKMDLFCLQYHINHCHLVGCKSIVLVLMYQAPTLV